MRKLRISEDLALPLDFATKTAAILAQRRKGKTYTASVLAEEMVASKQPFVALDPTGAWWGLRGSADGDDKGLPVLVLGGQHGQLPLERTGGKVVADLVVDEPGFYVIDFSLFESGEAERQFAVDFAERLYRAKGHAGKDFPLHLFVDEADRFIPQQIRKGSTETSARLLGAFEAIVRRGGLRGLGTTLISQRAAVVNKNVLEMIDVLIALRTIGPNDRDAIDGYIKAHGTDEQRKELLASLASLDIGTAWIWEPGAEPPLFKRVRIRRRRTLNSSATPKPGERRVEPRQLAEVDLEKYRGAMAATIERAKADDPKELRRELAERSRRIVDLEKQVAGAIVKTGAGKSSAEDRAALRQQTAAIAALTKALEAAMKFIVQINAQNFDVPGVDKAEIERAIEAAVTKATQLMEVKLAARGKELERLRAQGARLLEALKTAVETKVAVSLDVTRNEPFTVGDGGNGSVAPPRPRAPRAAVVPAEGLTPYQQELLDALAWLEVINNHRPTRGVVAFIAKKSQSSSTFERYVSMLSGAGYLTVGNGTLSLTEAGRAIAHAPDDPPSVAELQEAVYARVTPYQAKLLRALIGIYPKVLTRDELADAIQQSSSSSTFERYVSMLSGLGLIEYPERGQIRASSVLFLEGEEARA